MKKVVLMLVMALSAGLIFAQGKDDNSTMTKKEKRKAETEQQYQKTKQMLEDKNFVLESDYLQDRYGNRVIVNSTINFIAVDSATAVIQVGSNYRMGPNGVGGITAKGRITNWDLKEDPKHSTFNISMNVMTTIGIYDVNFSIGASGQATARLTGLRAGQLTFDGDLVPTGDSSVYEGQSL